jgi:hypothetical protein
MSQTRALQGLFFGHHGGRDLEELLRDLGHIGATLETDQMRIEHNMALRILAACGANIQIGREHIPPAAAPAATEQDEILKVQGGPNARQSEPQ